MNLTSINNVSSNIFLYGIYRKQYVSICHTILSGWAGNYLNKKSRSARKSVPSYKDDRSLYKVVDSSSTHLDRDEAAALTGIIIFLIRRKSRELFEGDPCAPFIRQVSHSIYLIRQTLALTKSRFDGDESAKIGDVSRRLPIVF